MVSYSTDELITCLKTKPEALFELVKETKKLDDGILFKLVDDTEVKIFKSDLTADMHTALVGENGLLVTGDYTEEMAKAFDDAVKNAKARGITDVGELIGTGKMAAEAVEIITIAGYTADELAILGVKTEEQITSFASLIKSGAEKETIGYLASRFNLEFSDFERFGLTTADKLNSFCDEVLDFTNNLIQHTFKAEINGSGELVGYHYEGFPDAIASVDRSTVTAANQYGVYQAEVYATGYSKTELSTFFPSSGPKAMTPKQVVEAIHDEYWNRSFTPEPGTTNLFKGTVSIGPGQGMDILMYINKDGQILSAFPKYP